MEKDFYLQIQRNRSGFTETDKHIADYIIQNANLVIKQPITDLASDLHVAPSTVISFCKQIGYTGYTELKLNIAQSLSRHLSRIVDDVKIDDAMPDIITKVFRSNINALQDTLKSLDGEQVANAIHAILKAKKILVFAIGSSGLVAQDAYNRFLRIGIPIQWATDPLLMRLEAGTLDDRCVAIAVSYAGRTADTIRTAQIAKNAGAKMICLSSSENTPLTELCEIVLIAHTHETKLFREAASSRLAQLAVIDALFTGVALADYNKTRTRLDEEVKAYRDIRI